MVEMLTVALWLLGGQVTHKEKVALRQHLSLSKAVQTGGYHKKVLSYEPCVYPNLCNKGRPVAKFMVAAGPFTTCQWPNTCSKPQNLN